MRARVRGVDAPAYYDSIHRGVRHRGERPSDVKLGALVDYLTVQLDSGDTVRASSAGKIDYRPGQRVLVKEKSTNFFGIRKHEFKKYLDERRRSDENRKFSSADIGTHVCH